MSKEFLFPDVGEGIAEGKLVEWKVAAGDSVEEDAVVADVETDKAVVEIPSPQAGVVEELCVEEGAMVHVGDVLLRFSDGSSSSSSDSAPAEPEVASEKKELKTKDSEVADDHRREPVRGTKKVESNLAPTAPTPEEHEPPVTVAEQDTNAQGPVSSPPTKRVLAAPSTRRRARELSIDISSVEGSGPNGRVLLSDLEGSSAPKQEAAAPAPTEVADKQEVAKQQVESQPEQKESSPKAPKVASSRGSSSGYSGRRKAIGDHLSQTTSIPTVTEFATADVTAVIELREHLKEKASSMGVKLTYLAFFVKAVCSALRKYPQLNSHFLGDDIEVFDDVHIGLAVDTDDGLIVPVIQAAERMSVLEIAKRIEELASQARDGSIDKSLLSGSTFSISSIGRSRVEHFTPILNAPEAAILGIGGFTDKPVVVDDVVEVRSTAGFSVTYDHRVVDGAYAAEFLSFLVELVEDPELLVLGGI